MILLNMQVMTHGRLSWDVYKRQPLTFTLENAEPIVVQDILDQILVGVLPLICIFGIYWYFTRKGANYNKVILGILIISMIASFFGILG